MPRVDLHFERMEPDSGPLAVELSPVQCQPSIGDGTDRHDPIRVTLTNRTDELLLIDWDRSSFVDESNRSHRLIHKGKDWEDRDEREQRPTAVAAGTTVEDLLYSADAIDESGPGFRMLPFLKCEPSAIGLRYRLVFSVSGVHGLAQVQVPVRVTISRD